MTKANVTAAITHTDLVCPWCAAKAIVERHELGEGGHETWFECVECGDTVPDPH